jgi:PPP family 3-phenylpropionic acid transporter
MPQHRQDHPQIIAGGGFVRRLALFYAAIFVVVGVQLPFFPLWLQAKGIDAQAIGFILATPMIVRVFAIPIAARQADRRRALRAAIIATSAAGAVGIIGVGLADGSIAILIAFSLASIAFTPIMPLADAYALRGLAQYGRAYGPVRLWGSAAFVVGSLGTGWIIDSIAPRNVIWLIAAAMIATAAAAGALAPLNPATPAPAGPEPSHKEMLRTPGFVAVAIAAGFIQASHAVYYGFSTLDWKAAGLDGTAVGALWALGVVAEITLFAISGRLPAAPTALLLVGAGGATLRWTAMALDPPAAALPFLQCLHGLSFGATHLGAIGFLARAAPPGLAATAQAYLAIALGLIMAAAMGLSGLLYGAFGSMAYAAMAAMAAAGGLVALLAQRAARTKPP